MKNENLFDFIEDNKNEDIAEDKIALNKKEAKEICDFNIDEITDVNNFYKNQELNKKGSNKNLENDILSKLNNMNVMNSSFDSVKQQGNLAYFDFTKNDEIGNINKKIEEKSKISKPKSSSSLKAKLSSKEEFKSNKYFDESFRENDKIEKSENLNEKNMKLYRLNNNRKDQDSESGILLLYLGVVIAVFLMLIFLFFYIHFGNYTNEVLLETKDFILSMTDDRSYKSIKLSNGIEVIIISDSKVSKSSASLTVGVGSLQDPEKIPGLSHLLEHIVFSGSNSFPKRNYFDDYLNLNNGISNAFTDDLKTTFYFESNTESFQKALQIFSKMLLEPLITDSQIQNEINNIEIEFYKNIENDSWREHQLIKNLANSKHPYNWFGIGSKLTFKSFPIQDLKNYLISHFNEYYQPFNMKLTVISNLELIESEDMITDYFSLIKETKKPRQQYSIIKSSEKVYNEKDLGKIVWFNKMQGKPTLDFIFTFIEKSENLLKDMDINSSLEFKKDFLKIDSNDDIEIESENDKRFLKLSNKNNNSTNITTNKANISSNVNSYAYIDDENEIKYKKFTKFKRIKPYDYLTYQLNYTGNGSLIEYLKLNNLSSKIESGMLTNNNNFYQYAISVTLTNEGVEKSVNVIDTVFAYLNVIRNSPINKSFYDEIQNIGNLKIKFQEQNLRLSELSSQISSNMFDFPYKEISIADNMYYKFDNSSINEFLSILLPENCIILLGDKNFISNDNLLYKSFFSMSNLKVDSNYNTNYLDGDFDTNSVEILKNSKVKNYTFQFRPSNNFISKEDKLSYCLPEIECLEEMNTRKPNKISEEKRLIFYHKVSFIFDFSMIEHF